MICVLRRTHSLLANTRTLELQYLQHSQQPPAGLIRLLHRPIYPETGDDAGVLHWVVIIACKKYRQPDARLIVPSYVPLAVLTNRPAVYPSGKMIQIQ